MSIETRRELGLDGHSQGYKINQATGEKDKREYSFYLEAAEKYLNEMEEIAKRIEGLEQLKLVQGEGRSSTTINKLKQEIEVLRAQIRRPASSFIGKTPDNWKRVIEFEAELVALRDDLGIPKLEESINHLRLLIKILVREDKASEASLRKNPPNISV